jgi:branched-subunit amino acid transport protein
MPNDNALIWLFLGMFAVTYIPRVLPLTILSRVTLPRFIIDILAYVPLAILSALLIPSLLMTGGEIDLSLDNHLLIAGALTAVISVFTKKLVLIVISGIVITAALVNFF